MTEKKQVRSTSPSLVGKEVYLRPTTADDAANAHYWFLQSEPQSMSGHPLPLMTAAEAAEAFKKNEKSPERQSFTIVREEDNIPVGTISFFNHNPLNRSAELGILIDPDERKNGFGSEALKILIKYLFKHRGLNKVYARTPAYNTGAVKLLESLGFKRDATLRNHRFYDGEFHDELIYSLLLFEWSG